MSGVTKARSDLALKIRWRDPEDPEITKARAALAEAKLIQQIRRAREGDPPLSEEQRSRLAALLLAPSGGDRDESAA